jgi:anti-sigma factor RsiW
MTCDDLLAMLVDFLSGELVVEHRETFELHIRGCPKCEAYIATYTHTVRVVRALPKCGLPAAFEARLRKLIEPHLGEETAPPAGN